MVHQFLAVLQGGAGMHLFPVAQFMSSDMVVLLALVIVGLHHGTVLAGVLLDM